jgi:concentrative nucleoside transporter, CNT family
MISLLGVVVLLSVAVGLSSNRSAIRLRTVGLAFALQVAIGFVALFTDWGIAALSAASDYVAVLLGYSRAGMEFMFGGLVGPSDSLGFIFAFSVLPVVIFFSSLIAVLYHARIMQWLIRIMGGGLRAILRTSHTESLSAAANVFVGQAEAPLVARPYIPAMTRSELFAVMVGGMASIAGSVMAGYVALGVPLEYLLAASFMAAPGGLLMAKLMEPETDTPAEPAQGEQLASEKYINFIDAAATGAMNGLQMVGAIGAMLLAFIALIAMVNGMLEAGGAWIGIEQLTLERLLGGILQPLAWAIGIPWDEAQLAGSLIGQKFILNEFVAYVTFSEVSAQLSPHSQAIVIFSLCGFANLSSIAILLGGLGAVAPGRRDDISRYGFRALIAASLSNLMSAALAGFFLTLGGT